MRLYRLPAPERRLAPMRAAAHVCVHGAGFDLTKGREGRCPSAKCPTSGTVQKLPRFLQPCMVVVLHAFVIYMFLKDFYVIIF